MSDRPKRKLIEVALPLEAINVAASHEKAVRVGGPFNIHYWWARRPLSAARAVLFASIVDDPSSDPVRFPTEGAVEAERLRLFGLLERLVEPEGSGSEAALREAAAEILRSSGGSPPPVFDPFCGGGTIPLEAMRLGLTAYASDLNPVAVLITKALVEIAPRFADRPPSHPDARDGVGGSGAWTGANGLAEDVRRYGAWMLNRAAGEIGQLFPEAEIPSDLGGGTATVVSWLWARTARCPNPACGSSMPLVRSFELSRKAGRRTWVQPVVDQAARRVTFTIESGQGPPPEGTKVGRGSVFRCLVCAQVADDSYLKQEGVAGRMGAQLMAVVAEARRGRTYLAPTEHHERIAQSAAPAWIPDAALSENQRHSTPPAFGLRTIGDVFTSRQLVALTALSDSVAEARRLVIKDAESTDQSGDGRRLFDGGAGPTAYGDAVAIYLGLAVSNSTARNNSLVSWMLSVECPSHLFSFSAFPMAWDFAEANILAGPTGSFDSILRGVAAGVASLPTASRDAPHIEQQNATHAQGIPPVVVSTDPPYYDNVPYADLSDFFYVWLRRALSRDFPEFFKTVLTPKAEELVADSQRAGSKELAAEHFKRGFTAAFSSIKSTAHPDFPVTVYYAFKQSESSTNDDGSTGSVATGWEKMLDGLVDAGYQVTGTWPVRMERQARARSLTSNALASTVVLVCRARGANAGITTRKALVDTLRREMPEALRTLQHGNIAPVDLAQASIGPGMAVFSRFAKVLEPDGSAMRVRTALALINQALDEILTEQEGEFDADTRWAIAWYDQFGMKEAAFGAAETLATAKNTSVQGLVAAGIVAASRGRARLLNRNEYNPDWDPSKDKRVPVWEATQRLVHLLLTDGEAAAGDLLARLGGLGDVARGLAYRLYLVAERKGWTDEAISYNALVVAWTDLVRGADASRRVRPAQTSLGLE